MEPTEKSLHASRRRIYLMRHGDVSYFDAGGRPFRPDTVPLNPEGCQQAEAAGRLLAGLPIDRVVASDLIRSVQTAELAVAGKALKVETYEQLREIQPGRLTDIPAAEIENAFIGAFVADVTRESRFLAGETFGSLIDRVQLCFQKLLADRDWKHLLIVAHGGVNRIILSGALGIGLQGFGVFEQDPACLNILDVDNAGRMLIRLVNFTPYSPLKNDLELTTMERLYLEYQRLKTS